MLIDCTPLRLEQLEERRGVPFKYHERMQLRHRMFVADRKGEGIRGYNAVRWKFAENAVRLPRIYPLADRSEIRISRAPLFALHLKHSAC